MSKQRDLKHARRLAAWVLENLPDSKSQSSELLNDLAHVFPVGTEEGQRILEMRSHLVACDVMQKQLQLDFSK